MISPPLFRRLSEVPSEARSSSSITDERKMIIPPTLEGSGNVYLF